MTRFPKTFHLLLCELHYPDIHGKTIDSNPNIEQHYLVYGRYQPFTGEIIYDDYLNSPEDNDDDNINVDMQFLRQTYSALSNNVNIRNHPTIRNYHKIISRSNYINPEIGEYILLPTQEAVAVLKTFWIRIIQRKWKKVYRERMRIKSNIANLNMREIRKSNLWIPGLRGMLHELSK